MQKIHKAVLVEHISQLWNLYFQPQKDEKPKDKYRTIYPEIRPDLQEEQGKLLLFDGTLGEAGHAITLLKQEEKSQLLALDMDPQMLERARYFLTEALGSGAFAQRCELISRRFSDYFLDLSPNRLQIDIACFDLGVSLFHYSADSNRGFSFLSQNEEEDLDMRLDPSSESPPAADLLFSLSEEALGQLLFQYGEIYSAKRIARRIVAERSTPRADRLKKVKGFADFIWDITPVKERYKKRIHPATQVFQALRIAVNDELRQLQLALPAVLSQVRPYGLIAVITFHSLEDRIVKQVFRAWKDEGLVQFVFKKPVQALYNTTLRSERSAKLRVVRVMPK